MATFQPGDKVAIVGQAGPGVLHETFVQGAPVLVVVRQMPYDPDHYELSDGSIHRGSELHLLERPSNVEVEHVQLADGTISTHLKHAASSAAAKPGK